MSPSAVLALIASGLLAASAVAAPVYRFEVATFNATPDRSPDHFTQPMFDRLNVNQPPGNYLAMGTDQRRGQITSKGNELAVYYNTLTSLYSASSPGSAAADAIQQYCIDRFTSTGPRPKWVILNEISGSLWPNNATYRQWLKDCVARLHNHYGLEVILYSPFPNPGANGDSWRQITQDCYIGIEKYLSGEVISANGYSVAWCQAQYEASRRAYTSLGVDPSRLFLGEHFSHTTAGTNWGRAGLPIDDWERAVVARTQAAFNADFAGYLSYAWGKNPMLVPEVDMIRIEETYRSMPVLRAEVPEPCQAILLLAPLLAVRRHRFLPCHPVAFASTAHPPVG